MSVAKPKSNFSVVTPNYNMAKFLPETIESVLANLDAGDEYFIIDGGSTDGSVDVIEQYASRLTGWVSESDNGYADALAKGFRQCSGAYLCWINSSDLLLRGALQEARQALEETEADLIFGDDLYMDEQGRVVSKSYGGVNSLRDWMLYGGWTPLQDACYWRRSLYEQVGGLDGSLRFAGDYDFFLRASVMGVCRYVPKVFSAFRRHGGQKSISGSAQYEVERWICRKRMLENLGISPPKRVMWSLAYMVGVRWRHHVTSKWHAPSASVGCTVAQLRAG